MVAAFDDHDKNAKLSLRQTEILAKLLLGDVLGQVSEVDVAGGAGLLHGQSDRGRDLRGLAPANLQLLAMERQLLNKSVCVESGGSCAVEEGQEDA